MPCAMTMPLATIMGSGPVKAARLSLREAFKVIACCLKTALFMPLKASENRKEDKVSVQSYWQKHEYLVSLSVLLGGNSETTQTPRRGVNTRDAVTKNSCFLLAR